MAFSFFVTPLSALVCMLNLSPNCDQPLTALIRQGNIQIAQQKSLVEILGVESYSGYFTVDERYDSNMFFWFFPAEGKPEAPVLLWLNGGPGRPSTFGALLENGPLALNEKGQLERRKVSWTESFSMLYIDSPVGVGYSYTTDDQGYSRTMNDTSHNLYSALVQFFQMFPEHAKNDFYIGGQSYACKYIAPLGCHIHERNSARPEVFLNLKGVYLGGGYCDPIRMMPYFFDFVFNVGIISDAERRRFSEQAEMLIHRNSSNLGEYINTFFQTGYDRIDSKDHLLGANATNTHLHAVLDNYLASWSTRMLLHAGPHEPSEESVDAVRRHLSGDFLTSTLPHHLLLLQHYKVLHYTGNLDVIVNVLMTEAFLDSVKQTPDDSPYIFHSPRAQPPRWTVDGKIAGWRNKYGQLTRVIVRNAGHITPYDQPQRTLDMMKRFVADNW